MPLSRQDDKNEAASLFQERENQDLIAKIALLQDENFKVSMEMDELQKRIAELCDINADLQVQIHSFDTVITEKESLIQEKSRQIDELKAAVEEYSSITELLRADKSKLESHMQMMHQDLLSTGVSLSAAYRLNQSASGSLQTELALAQSPVESVYGFDHLPTNVCFASPLDETLDREVLLMMHGPSPDIMALEFQKLLNTLKTDFRQDTNTVVSTLKALLSDRSNPGGITDASLEALQVELDATREDWALSLDQLAQYTDSIEKELVKMASNVRRSRTEILHLSVRVQDQENQKRQLSEELEQLKTSQDSREASCQTPAPEEETGDDLEWDEEYALQDFLKKDMAGSNGRARDGGTDSGQTEDGDERWTVVNGEGEAGHSSTPVSAKLEASLDGQCLTETPEPRANHLQDEAAVPPDAPSQAVSSEQPAADALPDPSHSKSRGAETRLAQSEDATHKMSTLSDQDPTKMPLTTNNEPDEVTPPYESSVQPPDEGHEGQDDEGDASSTTSPILNQSAPRPTAEDTASPLPVLVEEEESAREGNVAAPTAEAGMAGTEQLTRANAPTDGRQSSVSLVQNGQSESSATSGSSRLEDKKGKHKKELEAQDGDAAEAAKVEQAKHETSATTEKECVLSTISDHNNSSKEDKHSSLSANDKEIESEFQRLALGFKCDMFTLEKRLRLEERSRDLAEENVRREVSSCQGLLQALTPLCEDDNQSMEIIHRLQKNLDILIQSMSRVSSRSEMLGAIHQESRIGKAVEVMIQHVENLRRVYTKEHAELLELRETLMQNERSFGSHSDRDEFRGKKPPTSQYYKTKQEGAESEAERLTRRSPWNVAGKNMARPPLKRFVSSAAWVDTEEPSVVMKGTAARSHSDPQPVDELEEVVPERRRSSFSELGSKLTSLFLPLKTSQDELFVMLASSSSSPASSDQGLSQSLAHSLTSTRATAAAVARGSRGLWLWLAMVLVLVGLLALLASLVMQPAVDAAPVGTGDSWMTIQQLLWPYTGLRHNGQPPV